MFLVSRIREEYLKDGDTRRAVADGLAKTARVITAVMQLLDRRNWWIPDWLEGILPRIDVERREPATAEGRP